VVGELLPEDQRGRVHWAPREAVDTTLIYWETNGLGHNKVLECPVNLTESASFAQEVPRIIQRIHTV
jgi:hypothetical protein